MSKNLRNTPPHWCRDALPSAKGWCHPQTGELLISVPGGVGDFAAAAITGEPTNSVDAIPTIEAPIGTIVKRKELEETAEEPQEVTENDPEKEESTVSKTNEETSKADLSVFMV